MRKSMILLPLMLGGCVFGGSEAPFFAADPQARAPLSSGRFTEYSAMIGTEECDKGLPTHRRIGEKCYRREAVIVAVAGNQVRVTTPPRTPAGKPIVVDAVATPIGGGVWLFQSSWNAPYKAVYRLALVGQGRLSLFREAQCDRGQVRAAGMIKEMCVYDSPADLLADARLAGAMLRLASPPAEAIYEPAG